MDSHDDTSYVTSTGDEYSDADNTVFYHPLGAKATSSKVIWETLSDMCKRSIGSKFRQSKDSISMDVDAFSFVISADTLNKDKKNAIREFLLSFGGASFGRCSFPTRLTGSNSKDSIFGCAGNQSQHLPHLLSGNEMLIIDTPVKIALHASCQARLIETLKSKGFFYSPCSVKTGVCFNPYAAANKPPYSVIVDSIIESCQVPSQLTGNYKSYHVIHVADMGFRSPIKDNFDEVSNLFKKCEKMERLGILVELTQFDIAFSFQAPQDHLIQASCKVNETHDKDSIFWNTQSTVYPLHKLPKFKNESLKKSNLKGTFEIKKKNWSDGRYISFEDTSDNRGVNLFSCSDTVKNHRETISLHSSTFFSLKGYSTIAHSLLQKRSKYPMTDKSMYGIGFKNIQYIQTLITNAKSSMDETFNIVKSHGIGFRIEVSIRPHFSDPIRNSRHCNDVLLLVYLALEEFRDSKFKTRMTIVPTTSVQTESMKLLSEISSLIRFRKDLHFNQVYKDERSTEWLRFHLSLLLITIGISPAYGIKYINQWLSDENRFDPHSKVFVPNLHLRNDSLVLIKHRMLQQFDSQLKKLGFSDFSAMQLRTFLEKSPDVDPVACFSSLSFISKHLLVSCLWTDIIPHLSQFLSQDKNKVKSYGNNALQKESNNNVMNHDDLTDFLGDSEAMPDEILNDLMEKAPIPIHPLAKAIIALISISHLWNPSRMGYNQCLFYYIAGCHDSTSLGYKEISDAKTKLLINNCINGAKLTREELRHICVHLIPSCSTRNQPILSYQRMLCHRYKFPISDLECIPTENYACRLEKNNLINEALSIDVAIVVSQESQKTTFHRTSENVKVEIISHNRILSKNNTAEFTTIFQHQNLYSVLSRILHSKSESSLRQMLFDRISRSKRSLKNIFLTSAGRSSFFFQGMNTIKDLEREHQFLLVKRQDSIYNLILSAHCIPEILCSLASYVYQKNIIFYDMPKNTTHVFMYWKSRSIQYIMEGCNWLPIIKSVIIRQEHQKIFKFQDPTDASTSMSPTKTREISEIFSICPIGGRISNEIRLNDLPNRHKTSSEHHFYLSLSKLLNKIDQRYLNNPLRMNGNTEILGLKPFILELSRSRTTQRQCFHDSVVSQCNLLSLPLRILSHWLHQNEIQKTTHKLLCPLVCLRHPNLIIGVFVSNEKKKETVFYAFNPLTNKVEMKKYPKFVRLLDRGQTLYLYSCPSRSEFFVTEDESLSMYQKNWRWELSLIGPYSHLNKFDFEKCVELMKKSFDGKTYSMEEEIEDFNWRPEYPNVVMKTTSIIMQSSKFNFISHSGLSHIALIFIFPTRNGINEWDICIVHHPCQDEQSAMNQLLLVLDNSPSCGEYIPTCVKGKEIEQCESGFYMLLYAYLAFHAKSMKNFLTSIESAKQEPDLKSKCQRWISSTMRTESTVVLPWLSQLLCDPYLSNKNDDLDQSSSEEEDTSEFSKLSRSAFSKVAATSKRKIKKHSSPTPSKRTKHHERQGNNGPKLSNNLRQFKGLKNPNNHCYMNVIIQLLYGMKCTRDHIESFHPNDNLVISSALKRLFRLMRMKEESVSIDDLKNTLVRYPSFQEFNNNDQHDSHHFMIIILDCLREEFLLMNNHSRDFWCSSILFSQINCRTCRTRYTNNSDYSSSIELEICGNNLTDCLNNFFRYESLERDWICQNCKKERIATKFLLLQERPILIITLKRFTSDNKKIVTDVKFPLEKLRLLNSVNSELQSRQRTNYNLFAVVNHLGTCSRSGHYNLFMKIRNGWHIFDDERIAPLRTDRVNSRNAYTLVYIIEDMFNELGA